MLNNKVHCIVSVQASLSFLKEKLFSKALDSSDLDSFPFHSNKINSYTWSRWVGRWQWRGDENKHKTHYLIEVMPGLIYGTVFSCGLCAFLRLSESLEPSFGNVVLNITTVSCPWHFLTCLQKSACVCRTSRHNFSLG